MGYDSSNPFINFPTAVEGNNSIKYGDYYYQNTTAGKRIVIFGGAWNNGTLAGISRFSLNIDSGYYRILVDSCLIKTAM